MLMSVSLTRYGTVVGLAVGAVLLAGCGSSGSKTDAGASVAPSAPASAAPTDSGSAAPTDGGQPSAAPSGGAGGYTGPTVGPGHKCGSVTVVTGSIQCSHAEKIFELYAQSKQADGKATFNGWSCVKEATLGVVCSRSGIRLRSAA